MKFIALIGVSAAISLQGINVDKMHNNASGDGVTNWRKPWP